MGAKTSKVDESDNRFLLIQGFIRNIITKSDKTKIIPRVITGIIFNYIYHEIDEWINNIQCDNSKEYKVIHDISSVPQIQFSTDSQRGLSFKYPIIDKGIWKFEMKINKRGSCSAIGIGIVSNNADDTFDENRDVEYSLNWYGYYHGGLSLNVCASSSRIWDDFHDYDDNDINGYNWKGKIVGIMINFNDKKLSPIQDGKIYDQYSVDIPSDLYHFHIWIQDGCQVIVYPPTRLS